MGIPVLDESQLTLIEYFGLFVALCAFTAAGFTHYKDWFTVDTSRTPSFSLWNVCYNGDWGNCRDPMSLENQYDFGAALISSRIFLILSIITLACLVVLVAASIWGSQKVNSTNPIIFPVLCIVTIVFQTLGNSIFEGAVRLRVTRYLTPYGMPRYDSSFGWAGWSAWVSFILTICAFVIYSLYFVFHNKAIHEMERLEDGGYDEKEENDEEELHNHTDNI